MFNRKQLVSAISLAFLSVPAANAQQAKNVIYMVADGAGFNTYNVTNLYNSSPSLQEGWTQFAMSTYPLRTSPTVPGSLAQDPNTVYDPAKNYDTTPNGGALEFAGYQWTTSTGPDSANTIASSMTGVKTYNNAVNVDGAGNDLLSFAEFASSNLGMRTGVVSTVQWPDATPAAFSGVSNISRANRNQIADQMLSASYIDVIMGAGNPDYNNDGVLQATPNNAWISNATWTDLKDGDAAGFSADWQLIQDKSEFEALAAETLPLTRGKVLGVVQSFDGKQQYRSADGGLTTNYVTSPGVNLRTDVPTLTTMVGGALSLLPDEGFFLGIEQGEVDRAMHSNHLGRTIEAMNEFNDTVAFIDSLLLANAGNANLANYDNTLLIVTADHDHLLLGADSDTVPFSEPTADGVDAGILPDAKFQTGSHSNQLIPIFAKGAGSELLALYADQNDFFTDGSNVFGHGLYLDQAELFPIFTTATTVPLPPALYLFGASILGMLRFRMKRA